MATQNPIIELKDISKVYGFVNALKKINLTINSGETVGLLGNNGAGKSTLLKIISLLIKPSYGSIEIFGESIKENTHSIKQKMGILLSTPFFYDDMSGRENLEFYYEINKRLPKSDDFVTEIAKKYGMKLFIDRPSHELSTGMIKKLEIIRAIFPEFPELLLLDEPFSGLDVENRHFLLDLIRNRKKDTTVILCSHDFQIVNQICDRVVFLTKGRIERDLRPEEFNYFLNKKATN